MNIIDGKAVSAALKEEIRQQVATFPEKYGRVPHLVVVRVGEDPASIVYVRNKEKACEAVGIRNSTIVLAESTTEEELLGLIKALNADDTVDGILVQLPLPEHLSEAKVIETIAREKDVDGFHPYNVAGLWQKTPHVSPCTPAGIMKLLQATGVDPKGKRAVVIGRSNIVGLPVAKMLLDANATVTLCHTRTVNLADETRRAEILVVAAGRAKMVTADMVSPGATIIDVGMDHDPETGKLCGDVDFDAVAPIAGAITPVPGGVGPMTIACLMENTVSCFLASRQ
ncbi:MAG: bifunctional methylenetetrahydrofolate dehydrogenase/methenyltetrahydrofolate cyclohydrolase FolD [Bacteroidales bacterium]|nr:bifunctional methylenetetrahydrofolate dehydrogenase/methenyltetrahydrofolate cyclohydrolase FolD [Bacteroidales bacterium]